VLNVWARFGDWPARRDVLKRCLAELKPDLVAFIEVIVLDGYDEAADIADGLGMHIVHQVNRTPDGAGIAVASRLPVRAVHEMDLHVAERPRDFPAGALLVEVDAGGAPLLFVNHMPSWQVDQENEREVQTVMVARKIGELGLERVVVAGDMDADPSSSSIRFWTGRQPLDGMSVCYRDAWEAKHPGERGETFTPDENPLVADPDWPFRRIDYVLVRCGIHGGPVLPIVSCERFLDHAVDGVWASDHFGVVADLEVNAVRT
jgi:endonuclease/exonuclease/phosphatase family metal-dependent hydrolase